MSKTKEFTEYTFNVVAKTEKAVMVTEGVTDEHNKLVTYWLPFSQIELEAGVDPASIEKGATITILVPLWLATEKGFA